ncbi:MAG: WG repeat-containing protein [Eubacteriales bacterium]|nr:WG repeat-containing protein [Eubacteriales bacterium]
MNLVKKTVLTAVIIGLTLSCTAFGYEVQYEFSDGIAVVKNDGKFGYIKEDGTELVPCIYDYAFDFFEGMANVVKNNKCGYIDKTGNIVIPCEYDGATDFSEGAAALQKDNKWAYVDKKGNFLTQFIYDEAGFFHDGFARVKVGELFGYINLSGVEVVPCMFDEDNAYIALYNAPKNQPIDSSSVTAMASKVTVDGIEKSLDAYEIKDHNYLKLRSLATALESSDIQIQVDWDPVKESIFLTSMQAKADEITEEANVAEITESVEEVKEETSEGIVAPESLPLVVHATSCDIYYNGKPVSLAGYEINGNNYFKLRDMTELFGIEINWDEARQMVIISTK